MTGVEFPFAALVGLDALKLALQLAAIDLRLSVLIRGDKGAGKSTAARGLSGLLAAGTPFVNLPIGATEDRLLGGLDVEKALRGEPALKPGLLAAANGGVLYVDEVNLLPDHLADALLDAVASGVHVLEREGFSATQAAQFVLIGSMNPEEGALRPQLLDRFALAIDVAAPMDAAVRCEVMTRRLAFDADAAAFAGSWRDQQRLLSDRLFDARVRLPRIVLPDAMLSLIAERVIAHGVRSLRADLAVVRASRALAALEGADAVEASHVEVVLPLALSHRVSPRSHDSRPNPPSQGQPSEDFEDRSAADRGGSDRVFTPVDVPAPRLEIARRSDRVGSSSPAVGAVRGTVVIGAQRAAEPRELDPRATLIHAAAHRRHTAIASDDLHERRRAPVSGTRYLFVVDSSGSHAVQERMRLVKGAVNGLLGATHGRHDEIVVITCRGAAATVLVQPTGNLDDAQRALEYMPTGGRTPLAHAIELAAAYVTDTTVLIVLTDSHANVPLYTDDPWADTLTVAAAIHCPSIVIDSEDPLQPTGRSRALASALRGSYARLSELDQVSVLQLVRVTA